MTETIQIMTLGTIYGAVLIAFAITFYFHGRAWYDHQLAKRAKQH